MSEKELEELYEVFCDLYEDDGSYERFLKSKIANKFSSLQSEVERLTQTVQCNSKINEDLMRRNFELEKEIERLKSSVSNEGVREKLKLAHAAGCRFMFGKKSLTKREREADFDLWVESNFEPSFEVEEKKEDTLNKE